MVSNNSRSSTSIEYRPAGCTCDEPSEHNYPDNPAYHRHVFDCELAPDINDSWNFYPHSGELEEGGVYVNPADLSCVWLLVKGDLCRVPVETELDREAQEREMAVQERRMREALLGKRSAG
jgi:hypothetical protein